MTSVMVGLVIFIFSDLQYLAQATIADFAISSGDLLIFHSDDGTETDRVRIQSRSLGELAYDVVHNRMFYVDKQNNNDAICGYYLSTKENECYIARNGRNILNIAYDPVTEKLFFTDANEKSINWFSLKRGYENNIYGNLLIKMDDRTPDDIAVDSCGGYIYWSKTEHLKNIDMERVRFTGSGREALFDKYPTSDVTSLTIDPQTQKIYFFDDVGGSAYLNSAHMNGTDEFPMIRKALSSAKELTVSKDYLYFIITTSGESYKSVWRYPKNTQNKEGSENSKEMSKFYTDGSLGIAVNYKIEDQIKGIQGCDSLSNLMKTITEPPVNTGVRYDVCVNYCLHGNCSVNDDGLPKCSCNVGYSGERCEVSACHGYCQNDGECSINEEDEPVCECAGNHEGARCEADVTDTTPTYDLANRNLTVADLG